LAFFLKIHENVGTKAQGKNKLFGKEGIKGHFCQRLFIVKRIEKCPTSKSTIVLFSLFLIFIHIPFL